MPQTTRFLPPDVLNKNKFSLKSVTNSFHPNFSYSHWLYARWRAPSPHEGGAEYTVYTTLTSHLIQRFAYILTSNFCKPSCHLPYTLTSRDSLHPHHTFPLHPYLTLPLHTQFTCPSPSASLMPLPQTCRTPPLHTSLAPSHHISITPSLNTFTILVSLLTQVLTSHHHTLASHFLYTLSQTLRKPTPYTFSTPPRHTLPNAFQIIWCLQFYIC